MIDLIFYYGQEIVFVMINGNNIEFASGSNGAVKSSIDGLKLSKPGIIKEYPDLKDREDWREEAIKRFKESIASMKDEESIAEYIIKDLSKYGYTPKWKQKHGFRRISL